MKRQSSRRAGCPNRIPINVRWQYLLCCVPLALGTAPLRGELVNVITIDGETRDLMPGSAPHENRFGAGSDVVFDPGSATYFGLADKGPEGSPTFKTRIQQFSLALDPKSGAISDFQLLRTIPLLTSDGSASFDGRDPMFLHGDASTLGRSLDPEGLAIGPAGNFYIADEYGPSIYEFARFDNDGQIEARFARAFQVPDNLVPRDTAGNVNYVATRSTDPAQASGRQSGRGYEGLTITPDGKSLLAVLQDPLADEGDRSDGRRGPHVRIVRFDVASGTSDGQFVYPLENIADVNRRVSADAPFGATNQGRNIGLSGITALSNTEFLLIERDGRGWDVENPAQNDPVGNEVGVKRIYQIDLTNATDVSQISLAGSSRLPAGVLPVDKRLLFDVQAALVDKGLTVPAKMEGLAIGPRLQDDQYSLLITTDNDFSTLEVEDPNDPNAPSSYFDVYTDGTTGPLGGDPQGRRLLPIPMLALRLPSLFASNGDLDKNGTVDVADADQLSQAVASGQHAAAFDLTTDKRVDGEDLRYFVKYLAKSWMGDANLDGQFDSHDLVAVTQAGKYESDVSAVWSEGDWLGDGRFNSSDIVAALQEGGYEAGPRSAVAAVPEPSTIWPLLMAAAVLARRLRRTSN